MRDYLVHLKHILDLWRSFPLRFCLLLLWDWVRSLRLPLGKAAVAYEERKHERILTYLFARYDHLVPSVLSSKGLMGGGGYFGRPSRLVSLVAGRSGHAATGAHVL